MLNCSVITSFQVFQTYGDRISLVCLCYLNNAGYATCLVLLLGEFFFSKTKNCFLRKDNFL